MPDVGHLSLDVRKRRVVSNNFRMLFDVARFRRKTRFILVYRMRYIRITNQTQYNAPQKNYGAKCI